jgi:putative PEP-CTERM system TPR-repeat lipoprotein
MLLGHLAKVRIPLPAYVRISEFLMNRTLKPTIAAVAIASLFLVSGCDQKTSPKAALEAAQAAVAKGDYPAASIHLKNVLAAQPEDADSRISLGKVYLGMGEFGSAESDLRKSLELGGDKKVAVPLLLESLLMQNQFQKVVDDSTKYKSTDEGLQAQILAFSGRANFQLKQIDKARDEFNGSLKLAPSNPSARVGLIAVRLVDEKDLSASKAEIAKILSEHPTSQEAWAMSGFLSRFEGNNEQAKVALIKSVELKRFDFEQRAALIRCLVDLREFTEANDQIQTLSQIAPKNFLSGYLAGLVAHRQGNYRLAREYLQRVVSAVPGYTPALQLAAETAIENREFATAEKHAKALIERNPKDQNAYRLLAASYLAQNFPEKALAVLQPLLQEKDNSPLILATAGEALLKTGDVKKGLDYLDAASAKSGGAYGLGVMAASARISSGDEATGLQQLEQAAVKSKSSQTDLNIAQVLVNAKKYDKAYEFVAKFIQAQPKDPAGRHALAVIALAQGKESEAASRLAESLTLNASFQPSLDMITMLDLKVGKIDVATKRFSDLLVKEPKNTSVLLALAGLSAKVPGGEPAALAYFKQARESDPGSAQVPIIEAQYFVQTGQPDKAVTLLEQIAPNFANDLDTGNALASAYEAAGEVGKAVQLLEKQLETNSLSASLHYRIGALRLKLQDKNGATASFQRAAQMQPNALEPKAALASLMFADGKRSEAIGAAQALKVFAPKNPLGAILLGDFLTADGKKSEALTQYKEAYSLQKSTVAATKIYQSLQANGNVADASQFLRTHWQAFPTDLAFMLDTSEWLLEKKEWKEAVAVLNQVLKISKDNTQALNNAAIAMHQLKEPRAVELAQRAYQLEPNSFAIQDTFGYILLEQNKLEQALPILKAAAEKAPRNPEVRLHYGQALAKKGDGAGAKEQAKQALQNNPSPDVKAAAEVLLK